MSTLKAATVYGLTGTDLPDNIKPVAASAWVTFNGIGVVAILDNHNVSSVTDNGVGDYDINFSAAMDNANYTIIGSSGVGTTNMRVIGFVTKTVSEVRIVVRRASDGSSFDMPENHAVIFGGND